MKGKLGNNSSVPKAQRNKTDSKLYEFGPETKRIIVVGDLHGDFASFVSALDIQREKPGSYILFLGDYGDRGTKGIEITEALIKLSREPGVVALKGNHEEYPDSGIPLWGSTGLNLISEVERKRGNWEKYFKETLQPFYNRLPIAALLPGKLLFVHGGISNEIKELDNLKHPTCEISMEVLWNDPGETLGVQHSTRGYGKKFGQDISATVLKKLRVIALVRGHEPTLAQAGPNVIHDGMVVTISSCRKYGRPHCLEIDVENLIVDSCDSRLLYVVRYLDEGVSTAPIRQT